MISLEDNRDFIKDYFFPKRSKDNYTFQYIIQLDKFQQGYPGFHVVYEYETWLGDISSNWFYISDREIIQYKRGSKIDQII